MSPDAASYNLGWWRGRHAKPVGVLFASTIDRGAYLAGYRAGQHARRVAQLFLDAVYGPDWAVLP